MLDTLVLAAINLNFSTVKPELFYVEGFFINIGNFLPDDVYYFYSFFFHLSIL